MNASSGRRGGRHWMFTAAAAPLVLGLWWAAVQQGNRQEACFSQHPGAAAQGYFEGPCGTTYAAAGFLGAAAVLATLALIIVGLPIGLREGRHRVRFAHGRRIPALVVGLAAPWALASYALGYGIGRLLPAPKPTPAEAAHREGWRLAGHWYTALAAGHHLPVKQSDVMVPGPVHLDTTFAYARFYGMNVTYRPGSTFAFGSPAFVAGAAIGNLVGTAVGHSQAASMARPQWRELQPCRAVVTSTATWCNVAGQWLPFSHDSVIQYQVSGNTCVLTFTDTEPLRLIGPSVWLHAVLFARLRFGAEHWQRAPFLQPLRSLSR